MKGRAARGGKTSPPDGWGPEALIRRVAESVRRPEVARRLRHSLEQAAGAKRQLDQNMQVLLSLLNLPSRSDYERLSRKVDVLQGSILNVNMKLDRLLAGLERLAAERRVAGGPEPARAARSRRREPRR